MKKYNWSHCSLLNALRRAKLVLPHFQRDYVWDVERCRKLLASVILKYPLGALLIGTETPYEEFMLNRVLGLPYEKYYQRLAINLREDECSIEKKDSSQDRFIKKMNELVQRSTSSTKCDLLLDGQQRLTSLNLIFSDYFSECNGKEFPNRNLRGRWFLDLKKLGLGSPDITFPEKLSSWTHEEVQDLIVFQNFQLGKRSEYTGTELQTGPIENIATFVSACCKGEQ